MTVKVRRDTKCAAEKKAILPSEESEEVKENVVERERRFNGQNDQKVSESVKHTRRILFVVGSSRSNQFRHQQR